MQNKNYINIYIYEYLFVPNMFLLSSDCDETMYSSDTHAHNGLYKIIHPLRGEIR